MGLLPGPGPQAQQETAVQWGAQTQPVMCTLHMQSSPRALGAGEEGVAVEGYSGDAAGRPVISTLSWCQAHKMLEEAFLAASIQVCYCVGVHPRLYDLADGC